MFCSCLSANAGHGHEGDAHPAHPSPVPAEVTYKPSAVPDRILLSWTGDPATSQAVTWRTDTTVTQAFVEYAEAEDGPGFVDRADRIVAETDRLETNLGPAHYHSITLAGLVAETKYVYRVGDGSNWSEWSHFTTASDGPKPFSFVYFGDSQNDVKSHWSRVIRDAYRDAPRSAFLLHAGDLVNRADNDAEWGEWFYAQGFIPRTTPCLAIPGNHEQSKILDETTGEVTRQLTNHWERVFEFPENGPAGSQEAVYWIDYQGVRFIGLNSTEKLVEQAEWLKGVLSSNPQRWTIVTFHHPIYSSKRGRDNRELRDLWQPIFDEYQVDLVLNGHDHTYARTKLMTHGSEQNVASGVRARSKRGGTVYVVSVSGPKMYDLGRRPFMQRVAEDTQLYQVISIDGDELRFDARTATGKPYDGFRLIKRQGKPNQLLEEIPDTPEKTRPASENAEADVSRRESDRVAMAKPTVRLLNPQAQDQDDLCVWRDHESPERSVIITSDKAAGKLFVYDLDGSLLHSVDVPKPGNVDLRRGVALGGDRVSLVAVNQREAGYKLRVFRFDTESRQLVPVDGQGISTGPNYGGCLYYSRQNDRLYFFTTSEGHGCEQFELRDDGRGELVGEKVRHIQIGKAEGAVADDELGLVYFAEEEKGVWRFEADPESELEGELILEIGENGIEGDLEGLALTEADGSIRYLTASDQGTSTFHVLPLTGTRRTYRFAIEGATDTDGIAVSTDTYGARFPDGFFACHSDDQNGCPILLTPLQDVLAAMAANER